LYAITAIGTLSLGISGILLAALGAVKTNAPLLLTVNK
jgi:hypothetical protein